MASVRALRAVAHPGWRTRMSAMQEMRQLPNPACSARTLPCPIVCSGMRHTHGVRSASA